ncbi:Uncharacterised protein [Streptococcus criceti]|nr:Uncharacterised protein [Streptococcus criceti]
MTVCPNLSSQSKDIREKQAVKSKFQACFLLHKTSGVSFIKGSEHHDFLESDFVFSHRKTIGFLLHCLVVLSS